MSLNRVFLLGNLGAAPELSYTPNQTAICKLRMATNERKKGADGQWTDHTEWHKVVCFGRTAENCGQYLSKGSQAFIEGRIQTRKYQDKDGKDQYWTEIIANTVQFIGAKGERANIEREDVSATGSRPMAAMDMPDAGSVSFDDDDIPF
jgi:single-strand DNA-binding protein